MTKFQLITTGSLAMSSSPIGWLIGIDSPASPCIRGFQFRWEQKVKVEGQRAWNTSTTDCSKPLIYPPNLVCSMRDAGLAERSSTGTAALAGLTMGLP